MKYFFYLYLLVITLISQNAVCAVAVTADKENVVPSACGAGAAVTTCSAALPASASEHMHSSAELLKSMIREHFAKEDYGQALKQIEYHFEKIGGRDKIAVRDAHILYDAGLCYLILGNASMAATVYEEYFTLIGGILAIPVTDQNALAYAAVAHCANLNYARALEINDVYLNLIGGIAAISVENAGALLNIANIYYYNGRTDLAYDTYRTYFGLIGGPDKTTDSAFLKDAGDLYAKQNDIDGASVLYYEYSQKLGAHAPQYMLPYIAHKHHMDGNHMLSLELYNGYFTYIGGKLNVPSIMHWTIWEYVTARDSLAAAKKGSPIPPRKRSPLVPTPL
jgi:tetratricopeptide (TPR) repeat protein